MIFGYNCLRIPDKGVFTNHIRTLKPPALLFYNTELDYARQLKAQFPGIEIIMRNWPDGGVHKRLTPSQWLDQRAGEAAGGLMLYTTNESGFDQDLIDWHISLMRMCIPRQIKLCVVNAAPGTWDNAEIERMRPMLELLGQHRDLFVLGLHSYAGGVITSGMEGGYPDHAGVDPNGADKDKGDNLIPQKNWPTPDKAKLMTKFHIGRHEWFLNYCKQHQIPPPRIGLTETGFDSLGDIGAWLQTIGNRTGHTSINGWHTLKEQWRQWFPDLSPDAAYVEQFAWAEKTVLQGAEFALFFAYGDDGNWANYDVSNSGIPALLEAKVRSTQEQPVVILPPPVDNNPSPPATPAPVIPPPDARAALYAEIDALTTELTVLTGKLATAIGKLKTAA